MALVSIFALAKERAKLERQGVAWTKLQKEAACERVISLSVARKEARDLLERLTHPQQNA